ncbi:TPA: class III signal peptide-containing protein [Candidatus Micrarchaeota archaeon]|nr:class III signal peptide-containing protein [Candidatus Micrarchaeota archaeon]
MTKNIAKGQLSAEMLILIAVILAIVAIVATQLIGTAQKTSEKIEVQSAAILEKTEQAVKGKGGDFCVDDIDCQSNSCNTQEKSCT